jgi:hypothetical protein
MMDRIFSFKEFRKWCNQGPKTGPGRVKACSLHSAPVGYRCTERNCPAWKDNKRSVHCVKLEIKMTDEEAKRLVKDPGHNKARGNVV